MAESLKKFVFIQNDPFFLPTVLDKFLREFADSTVGVNLQSVSQGKRGLAATALALWRLYGCRYFLWKLRRYLWAKLAAFVWNGIFRTRRRCYSVKAVARKYGVPVCPSDDVNGEEFRALLRENSVELIVSISGARFIGTKLREQTPRGVINCHGALLPKYRGLMPSFWTLAKGERRGGVTVHFVDGKIDNGPILVQRSYRIRERDTLEEVMARSKSLAAEAVVEAVRVIEMGDPPLIPNRASEASEFSMPGPDDAREFLERGHRFY